MTEGLQRAALAQRRKPAGTEVDRVEREHESEGGVGVTVRQGSVGRLILSVAPAGEAAAPAAQRGMIGNGMIEPEHPQHVEPYVGEHDRHRRRDRDSRSSVSLDLEAARELLSDTPAEGDDSWDDDISLADDAGGSEPA